MIRLNDDILFSGEESKMLKPLEADVGVRVRDYFRECQFDKAGLAEAGFGEEVPSKHQRNLQRLLWLAKDRTPLSVLYRLFRVGVAQDEQTVGSLLPAWFVEACGACGLLRREDGRLSSPVMLTPFDDLIVASDHTRVIEDAEHADAVLHVNATTWLLYRYAVRRPSSSTLELCAGSGAIGLGATAWSDRVVLTDLSSRAMEFARFSASLNGFHQTECLTGDSLSPVAGRRFDLILANPPFYVTPAMNFLFVHNELGLDQFCRRLVRQSPEFLNEGGYYQMLCEWVEVDGQSWQDRLREWFAGTGCDVWAVKSSTTLADQYAQLRIDEAHPFDWANDVTRFPEWMAYYSKHGVTAIHGGMIAMRKRSGRNWVRLDEATATPDRPFGDAVMRAFNTFTWLEQEGGNEAAVLGTRFLVSPGVKLTQRLSCENSRFQPESLELSISQGLPYEKKIDPMVAAFLSELDGSQTLAEACDRIAQRSNVSGEKVRSECIAITRKLLERGFLYLEAQRAVERGTKR
jgi:hypothetical protein